MGGQACVLYGAAEFGRDVDLLRGHAVHFRCQHPEVSNLRLDVMSVMRGLDPFLLCGSDGRRFWRRTMKPTSCCRFLTW